jgi:hypothetical protein
MKTLGEILVCGGLGVILTITMFGAWEYVLALALGR